MCVLSKERGLALFTLACVLISLLSSGGLYGQAISTGTVQGAVTDPTGASVAGATVTLTENATSTSRTTVTNDSGRYIFADVPPGIYDVSVSKTGFRVMKFIKQEVTVGETFALDTKLELGPNVETIEVSANSASMDTASATIGNTITGVPLDALPGLGRDVTTFVTLQPGIAPDGSTAGANQDQNSFMLDGGNNSSDMDGTQNTYTPSFAGDPTGGLVNTFVTGTAPAGAPGGGGPTGVMPTPADSIEEFKMGTSNQTADFNSSAGAQVQLVTKRGTNQWHGTAYEYYLDNSWGANSFPNNATDTPKPSYHYNRFGGSVGGPIVPKDFLGGKWYFFANYEGFRWPDSETVTRAVPSEALEQGILQFAGTAYNLNPTAVTYNGPPTSVLTTGETVQPAVCPAGPCDPRGLGISPTVQQMWTKYMPPSNISSCAGLSSRCDGLNVLGFRANMALPWDDNFGVARLDHDFTSKWHFYSTYRYYKMERATGNQIDIGGFYPGDKLGVPASVSDRPQDPWYLTAGLTTNISTNVTNDFHYSFLRNYWARASNGQAPQVPGLAGALEPYGENASYVLAPVNLDTQDVRTRFWDGHDSMIRDDISWAKGTHFFQFGGTYQHNYDWHQRTDNGGGINYETVYWLGQSVGSLNGMNMTGYIPNAVTAAGGSDLTNYQYDYGIALGIPGVTQIAYTRTGSNLTLNPPKTPAFDQSTIPFYNLYFSDSWRMKPSFTLSYGLGWALEMPPVEKNGKQIILVGPDDKPLDTETYIKDREQAALAGQVYNPEIGFSLIDNVVGHPKYPYNPFYRGFSPRIAGAWNPSFDGGLLGSVFGQNKTVVRGGYSILYGRLNGVGLVLIPLLGDGLIQAVQCVSPLMNGACGGPSGSTPTNAFRIGPTSSGFDGLTAPLTAATQTLPQPTNPGYNAAAAGSGTGLDPNFRPSMSQQFDLTVQRQLNNKLTLEVGYIGRLLTHEFLPVNLNAVPYMMTLGGQRFDKAYGQMVWQYCGGNQGMAGGGCAGNLAAVTPEPFFEAALNKSYCAGYASCTQAVAANEGNTGTGNIGLANVWSIWSDLDSGPFNFPRSMLSTPTGSNTPYGSQGQLSSDFVQDTSLGSGNYNAMFVTVKSSQWHGVTLQSNFTYGKALGNQSQVQATSEYTVSDPFDFNRNYGLQPWDRKFMFNAWIVYQPNFFQNQHAFLGRLLDGWTLAPLIDIGSGLPLGIYTANAINSVYYGGQSFGAADGANVGAYENAINICGGSAGGSQRHNNPIPSTQYPGMGSNGYGPSLYQDPQAVYNCFRNPILGIDNGHNGGAGNYRGMAFWNVDFSIKKNVMVTERFSAEFGAVFTNIFNHNQMLDPTLNILGDTGDFGALENQANNPRRIELGVRVRF
jgi:Carboxypeptidase regulatory-like domain